MRLLLFFVVAMMLTYNNALFAQSGVQARHLRQQCIQSCGNIQSYYPEATSNEMANLKYQCISKCQNDQSFRDSLTSQTQTSIHDYPEDNYQNSLNQNDPKMQAYVDKCKNIPDMDPIRCLMAYKEGTPLKDLVSGSEKPISQDSNVKKGEAAGGLPDDECTDQNQNAGKVDANGQCIATPSSPTTPEQPNAPSQEALAQQAVQACQSAAAQVQSSCDSESQNWLQQINSVMGGVMPAIQAQQNTKAIMENKQTACGKLVGVESGVKGALATFQVMCSNASDNCNRLCDPSLVSLPAYKAQLTDNKKACNDKAISAKAAHAQAAQASQEIMVAVQSCRAMMEIQVSELPECAKPENRNNPGCTVNLGTPIDVNTASLQPSAGSGTLNHQGALGKTATEAGSDRGFALDLDDEEREVTPHKSTPGEEIGGSKGGGNVASTGGAGGGKASGRSGGESKGLLSNILSGFFGGGGGSGGSRSGGGGWRSFFGGGGGSQPVAQEQNKIPDLRQFMPGGAKDPNRHRGIAGQFIGKDGMSGPHGNIWKMINNRYQYKRASLLP